jgi:hypothetical protein
MGSVTEEADLAPLLDSEWARTFRSLEQAVDEIIERDHARGCEICDELTAERERRVALAWAALDGDEQARWLQAWGMTERGAAMRDALTVISPESLRRLTEMAEQARREP